MPKRDCRKTVCVRVCAQHSCTWWELLVQLLVTCSGVFSSEATSILGTNDRQPRRIHALLATGKCFVWNLLFFSFCSIMCNLTINKLCYKQEAGEEKVEEVVLHFWWPSLPSLPNWAKLMPPLLVDEISCNSHAELFYCHALGLVVEQQCRWVFNC